VSTPIPEPQPGPLPVPDTPLTAPRTPLSPDTAGTPIQGGPSTSLTGWNHFTRSLAEVLPSRSHEARTIRRAALRELQTKRKVGK
jgi:hypothetical protein